MLAFLCNYSLLTTHTEEVTISTLESRQRSRGARHRVAKLVLLLPEELDGFVVGRVSYTPMTRICAIVFVYAVMTFDTIKEQRNIARQRA